MLSHINFDKCDVNSDQLEGKTMITVKTPDKRDDKKFKRTKRDELIIIPTKKLLNWCKFNNE